MVFNFWRPLKWFKPKKEMWYQCTVKYGLSGKIENPMIMDLYWWNAPDRGGIWVDRRRESVFDGYKVYLPNRAAIDDNRVFRDNCCERIDVIAWRKLPKIYRWRKFKRKEVEYDEPR